jgi:hypothetical protein
VESFIWLRNLNLQQLDLEKNREKMGVILLGSADIFTQL